MTERSDIETGEAQFKLALAYEDGNGVKRDLSLAVTLYEKSANLGHMMAQYHLGFFHYWGSEDLGIDPNYKEAAKWYRMAAEQGDAETQCELGIMYLEGKGVQEDDKKAANWLLKAAEQGHPNVAYHLSQMYLSGEGITANNVKAYMWSKIAQDGREFDTGDTEVISRLKKTMSPKEIEKAEALASDWIENVMMLNQGKIIDKYAPLTTDEAQKAAERFNFTEGILTYILWDAASNKAGYPIRPLYVGTAKSSSRIVNHIKKDHGEAPLSRRGNQPFADFVEAKAKSHGPGWLNITLREHPNIDAAKKDERKLIKRWGIIKKGGWLFNQRLSG